MAAPEDFDEKVRALRAQGVKTPSWTAEATRPPQDVLVMRHEPTPETGGYDFLRLGEEIAKSLIETAEAQVVQAENMLKHTQAFAENVRAQITEKQRELAEMNERLRTFGATILDAHNKFHTPPTNGKAS